MGRIEELRARWLSSPLVSDEDKSAIKAMGKEELDDAFYRDIEFGTAGMRGVMGPGTNRLNPFTVKRASLAFARALLEKFGEEAKRKGIAISHDNRFHSREYAELSAGVFNKMGLKAYLFDDLRPTPELSFAVRYLKCVGGVMITASHNAKQYNGYKVYDEKGCQLVPEKIRPVLEIIAEYPDLLAIDIPEAEEKGVTEIIDKAVDGEYVRLCEGVQLNPDLDKKGFKIVYTPQHGASYENAMRVFEELGYDVHPVLSQCVHDPAFGATKSPNPENPDAYIEALKLAKEINADLIVMTDPDGDRVGVAYLSSAGDYRLFTGNESGSLLIDYVLSQRKKQNKLPGDSVLYDTVVTSDLGRKIARSYEVKNESFLTGFKFIGDAIARKEEAGIPSTFVFGYEESYGCLISDFVRDKDGIQAILLYCEMALWHFRNGRRLDVAYEELMERFGYHKAIAHSLELEGSSGHALMGKMMEKLHENPPAEIAGIQVIRIEDYEKRIWSEDGKTGSLELPRSELVKFFLKDGAWVAIRPSGTEPKIKFYLEAAGDSLDAAFEENETIYKSLQEYLS